MVVEVKGKSGTGYDRRFCLRGQIERGDELMVQNERSTDGCHSDH